MSLAPIALFVYKRLDHLKKTVNSLLANELIKDTDLYIFSDGSKNAEDLGSVLAVRRYINNIKGFRSITIIERDKNLGLANSIISGIDMVLKERESIIVLEDDLIVSSEFLSFMNNMLVRYKKESNVFAVSGYNYPNSILKIPKSYIYDIYFSRRMHSWGWATWRDRWTKADWQIEDFDNFSRNKKDKRIFKMQGGDLFKSLKLWKEGGSDIWAVRWCYAAFKNNGLSIYPRLSFVRNIGFDDSGVNCNSNMANFHNNYQLNNNKNYLLPNEIGLNRKIDIRFRRIFKKHRISIIIRKYFGKIKKIKKLPDKIKCLVINFLEKYGYIIKIGRVEVGSTIFSSLKYLFAEYKIDLVIDVGAYVGEYAKISRRAGYSGEIISFEPFSRNFNRISLYSKDDNLWNVFKFAIGNNDGSIDINIASDQVSSSALDLNDKCDYFKSKVDYTSSEEVEIRKLDTLLEQRQLPLFKDALLKVDVQGLEEGVIDGALNVLSKVKIVQLEMSLSSVYVGQSLMNDLIKKMEDLGYELFTILPVLRNEYTGQLIQVDGIFIRK